MMWLQNRTFPPAESPAATRLEALHAASTLALVCDASKTDLWRTGEQDKPRLLVATEAIASELLDESMVLATVKGPPDRLESYGLTLYAAEDTLPALFDKYRCVMTVP